MKIDVGGGTAPAPGHYNVDPVHGDPEAQVGPLRYNLQRRIQDGLSLPDGFVGRARASHVLEHVPKHDNQLLNAMNEVWRVLRPGAEFETVVPCVGYTNHPGGTHGLDVGLSGDGHGEPVYNGWQPWADPTHVSFGWYPESWWYFTGGPGGAFRAQADYGIRYWEWGEGRLVDGWEAHVVLVKPR